MVLRSSTRNADYTHFTAELDLTHCSGALSRNIERSSDPDRGRVEAKWSFDHVDPDPRSASDADPRSRVGNPNNYRIRIFDSIFYLYNITHVILNIYHTHLFLMIQRTVDF